jgi:hypothetical protein
MKDDSKITPLLHTDVADHVTSIPEADFFRVEIKSLFLGDFRTIQEAAHAFAWPIAAISRKALCRDTHKSSLSASASRCARLGSTGPMRSFRNLTEGIRYGKFFNALSTLDW